MFLVLPSKQRRAKQMLRVVFLPDVGFRDFQDQDAFFLTLFLFWARLGWGERYLCHHFLHLYHPPKVRLSVSLAILRGSFLTVFLRIRQAPNIILLGLFLSAFTVNNRFSGLFPHTRITR